MKSIDRYLVQMDTQKVQRFFHENLTKTFCHTTWVHIVYPIHQKKETSRRIEFLDTIRVLHQTSGSEVLHLLESSR